MLEVKLTINRYISQVPGYGHAIVVFTDTKSRGLGTNQVHTTPAQIFSMGSMVTLFVIAASLSKIRNKKIAAYTDWKEIFYAGN